MPPVLKGENNPAYKHGLTKRGAKPPNIYRRWQHMIQRCHNPRDKDYPNYGGNGITVCVRWREDFQAFLQDMGVPPGKNFTLDRIDNKGEYGPGNCRWTTPKAQANNRRSTKMLTIDGVTRPLSDWCEIANIGSKAVLYRLKHMGMSHKEAVFTPKAWTKHNNVIQKEITACLRPSHSAKKSL